MALGSISSSVSLLRTSQIKSHDSWCKGGRFCVNPHYDVEFLKQKWAELSSVKAANHLIHFNRDFTLYQYESLWSAPIRFVKIKNLIKCWITFLIDLVWLLEVKLQLNTLDLGHTLICQGGLKLQCLLCIWHTGKTIGCLMERGLKPYCDDCLVP